MGAKFQFLPDLSILALVLRECFRFGTGKLTRGILEELVRSTFTWLLWTAILKPP
jgi:hypothetical protein